METTIKRKCEIKEKALKKRNTEELNRQNNRWTTTKVGERTSAVSGLQAVTPVELFMCKMSDQQSDQRDSHTDTSLCEVLLPRGTCSIPCYVT